MLGIGVEIVLGGRFGTIDTRTHLDDVQVNLHDAFLAPECFNQEGVVGLQPLAYPGTARPAEDILGSLLRDGTAATFAGAVLALLHHYV